MKKKFLSLLLAGVMMFSMTACGGGEDSGYKIGVCQLMQHAALDKATEGFKDVLEEKLGDEVTMDIQYANGEPNICSTITNTFVANDYDLILGNATAALQSAVSATAEIPILGTSITDYATALGMDEWTGVSGKNVSGTTDLAPLDKQAECIKELFPDAKNVGILFCSAEANSQYQSNVIREYLTEMGYTCKEYTFADTNDVAQITQSACAESDVIYIPTDNTAADCTEAINNETLKANTPIFAGEEGICSGCGVATLSIDYYEIGCIAGEMAYEILVNDADPATMEVKAAPEVTKKYNKTNAEKLNITIPDGYTAIETEE